MKRDKLKLNTKKIISMLKAMDRDVAWLAKKAEIDRQYVHYWLINNSPQGAKPIAAVLGCDFRELLI